MNEACSPTNSWPIFSMHIRLEKDLVLARQRARQIASHLHYDLQELTRIATARALCL